MDESNDSSKDVVITREEAPRLATRDRSEALEPFA